jgi:hypothetical protein
MDVSLLAMRLHELTRQVGFILLTSALFRRYSRKSSALENAQRLAETLCHLGETLRFLQNGRLHCFSNSACKAMHRTANHLFP